MNPLVSSADPDRKHQDSTVMERMRIAFDLYMTAELMVRQNHLRAHPEATEEDIEEAIRAWLKKRPGAPYGDGVGTPR